MTYKNLKMIAVSEENYLILKRLGRAGDSFNDVIRDTETKPANWPHQSDQLRGPECGECRYNHVGA
jgi:hypothetical protein